jgi:GDP-fucose transporter C1
MVIAVLLFLVSNATGLLQVPLYFDKEVVQGLVPMIGLNVIGLRYAIRLSLAVKP